MIGKRGLFMDLDGTIIETVSGDKFPKDVNDWKFKENVLDVINLFCLKGFRICIVTNQGGIEKGFIRESDINIKLEQVASQIEKKTNFKPYYRFSPNFSDSYTRKPSPGMAYSCALKLELSLTRSIMVGDLASDKSFAVFAGIGRYYDINDFLKINENNIDEAVKDSDSVLSEAFNLDSPGIEGITFKVNLNSNWLNNENSNTKENI